MLPPVRLPALSHANSIIALELYYNRKWKLAASSRAAMARLFLGKRPHTGRCPLGPRGGARGVCCQLCCTCPSILPRDSPGALVRWRAMKTQFQTALHRGSPGTLARWWAVQTQFQTILPRGSPGAPVRWRAVRRGRARLGKRASHLPVAGSRKRRESTRQKADDKRVVDGAGRYDCRCGVGWRRIGEGELELELIQSHMAQKPVLRGEVGCACVARAADNNERKFCDF